MTRNGPPWSGRGAEEPYTEPADPWGDHVTAESPDSVWGAHPTSMPPAMDSSVGYPSQPTYGGASALNSAPQGWGASPAAPPRKRNTPIVALVVILGLLICGGLGTTAWLINQQQDPAAGTPLPAPSTLPPDDEIRPQPRTSEDARFVAKGQCVRNEGTPTKPDMKIVACASGTFEVLKRVDGRTTGEADAETKCSKVPDYTKWYFYDSELDSLDFVLCLRER
jgi:hypothetical protein